MTSHRDFPFSKVVAQANERVLAPGRGYVHQKWTCRHCGSRQTMAERNTFYRSGRCEECGQITIISKCNYLAVLRVMP
jgi:hypothetical protein